MSRCKPVYRVLCEIFYRAFGIHAHTTEDQKPGEMPIFPSYFSTMSMKKDPEELLLQGLS